jgi:hypothetical protein
MAGLPDALSDSVADKNEPPSAYYMNWLLGGADQRSPGAVTHRLGTEPHNAASGSHTHNGQDSQYLFDPTPSLAPLAATATNAQIIQKINDIVTHLASRGAGVSRG